MRKEHKQYSCNKLAGFIVSTLSHPLLQPNNYMMFNWVTAYKQQWFILNSLCEYTILNGSFILTRKEINTDNRIYQFSVKKKKKDFLRPIYRGVRRAKGTTKLSEASMDQQHGRLLTIPRPEEVSREKYDWSPVRTIAMGKTWLKPMGKRLSNALLTTSPNHSPAGKEQRQ